MSHRASLLFVAASVLGVVGCGSSETTPPPSELVLALQTDMDLPKDVDKVRIRVASYGNTVFSNDYPVGPNELRIPATLALFASEDHPSAPVTIQVIGFRQTKPRVMRESVTTIPRQRIATLRVPIEWLCDDSAKAVGDDVNSTCPGGDTCIAGTCTSAFVDSDDLPDFTPADVFGGGDGSGNGTCFDVGQCFSSATKLPVDMATCTVSLPADDMNLNFALKLPGMGDGICSGGVCLVPLDGGDGGQWKRSAGAAGAIDVQLPMSVCEKLQNGKVEAVLGSKSCPLKTIHDPTCGPWSSTGNMMKPIEGGTEGGGSSGDATTGGDSGGSGDVNGKPDTGGTLDANEAGTTVDAGGTIDGAGQVDSGNGTPDGKPPIDASGDPSCMGDNCGQPPDCTPPPPPADGGMCEGLISSPKPVSACQWDVPGDIKTMGTGFCGNLLNIRLANLPGGGMAMILAPTNCDTGDGWHFLVGSNRVELCSNSCAQSTAAGVITEFIYGCPSIIGPPADGGPVFPDGGTGPIQDASFDGPVSGDASIEGGAPGMYPIKGGTFSIGCAAVDTACSADETLHSVTVNDFMIDETEVTQDAYQVCVGSGFCAAPPCSWDPANNGNYPVTCVSWDDANSYCGWLGKRLPTEAEWEIAARGNMLNVYPWGADPPDCTRAKFSICSLDKPDPVRSAIAGRSPYGPYDMAGNVAEWVIDWYAAYDIPAPANPTGPAAGTNRVNRGGSFSSLDTEIRTSKRSLTEPMSRTNTIGFRCAKPGLGPQ